MVGSERKQPVQEERRHESGSGWEDVEPTGLVDGLETGGAEKGPVPRGHRCPGVHLTERGALESSGV